MKICFHPTATHRSAFTVLLALAAVFVSCSVIAADGEDFLPILERYFKATYARDYQEAYRHIAAGDQRLKDSRSYVRERGAFTGFTLEVARKLATYAEL